MAESGSNSGSTSGPGSTPTIGPGAAAPGGDAHGAMVLDGSAALKSMSHYSPYGWRGKIGVIVPSTNTATEAEWRHLVPEGVSFHVGRTLLTGATTQESYDILARGTERAAEELATAELDLLVFCCTSGSFMVGREALKDKLAAISGVPVTTTADAVLEAFAALGITRVGLATPYLDLVTRREVEFLEANGIGVTATLSLQIGVTREERRLINRVPPEVVFRMARAVDSPQAQAIFLSCTALPTMTMLERIEAALGKPVIASNPATLWHCLRRLGVKDRLTGYGKVFSEL